MEGSVSNISSSGLSPIFAIIPTIYLMILLFILGIGIYIAFLTIKALKIYIAKNSQDRWTSFIYFSLKNPTSYLLDFYCINIYRVLDTTIIKTFYKLGLDNLQVSRVYIYLKYKCINFNVCIYCKSV